MLKGHGNSKPDIVLISDGGTKEDATTGYCLSGMSEMLLKQVIGNAFHLGETYRTALIKEPISYEPNGKIPYYEEDFYKQKVDQYREVLFEELRDLNPNLLIPMGELSMRLLTEWQGIRKFRGSCCFITPRVQISYEKRTKVLPILGPQVYNKEYKQRWVSRIDFSKVPKYLNPQSLPEEARHSLWIAKTSSALRTFINRSYTPEGLLVFDIETFMGMPTCISLCFNGRESVCVPFMDKNIDMDNRVLMIQQVASLTASPIRKVNQNIKYDWKVLERFGFTVNNVVGDTMLSASLIYPELPKNLGFLTSIYTDLPYFKDEGRMFDSNIHQPEQFYLYNAKDSLATWQIHEQQQKEIDELGCREVHDNIVKLMPIYKSMENNGIRVDDEQRIKLLAKYYSLFEIIKGKQYHLCKGGITEDFNPLSSVKCKELVYQILGYPVSRYASGTTEEELEYLYTFEEAKHSPIYGKSILESLIQCRKIHKVIEYLELKAYGDGRWRSEYNLAGTETGRSSAGITTDQYVSLVRTNKGDIKVEIDNYGRSFQTIAKHGFLIDGEVYGKDLRTIFVPSSGYEFVEVDLSQAEARVDAVLAGNFDILSVFDSPTGIHRLTGSWVYECDPLTIKKNTLEYLMAKTVRHAGERNMKADRLVMMVQCTLQEARRVLDTFHKFQPEIRGVFHRDIIECINATRTLVCPNGRRRQFLDRVDNHLYNEAISYLPQAIVSDKTKFSLIPTLEECPWARLINEAHDGTLAEVPKGKKEEYIKAYQKNVQTPIDFRRCSLARDFILTIPSEASWSADNWYGLEDIKVL